MRDWGVSGVFIAVVSMTLYTPQQKNNVKDEPEEICPAHFQFFNFDDGRPLEPDFVLFLIKKDEPKMVYYQIFIEPKGGQFADADGGFSEDSKEGWKQKFLLRLKAEGKTKVIWENKDYRITGLPFYNSVFSEQTAAFEEAFEEYL